MRLAVAPADGALAAAEDLERKSGVAATIVVELQRERLRCGEDVDLTIEVPEVEGGTRPLRRTNVRRRFRCRSTSPVRARLFASNAKRLRSVCGTSDSYPGWMV